MDWAQIDARPLDYVRQPWDAVLKDPFTFGAAQAMVFYDQVYRAQDTPDAFRFHPPVLTAATPQSRTATTILSIASSPPHATSADQLASPAKQASRDEHTPSDEMPGDTPNKPGASAAHVDTASDGSRDEELHRGSQPAAKDAGDSPEEHPSDVSMDEGRAPPISIAAASVSPAITAPAAPSIVTPVASPFTANEEAPITAPEETAVPNSFPALTLPTVSVAPLVNASAAAAVAGSEGAAVATGTAEAAVEDTPITALEEDAAPSSSPAPTLPNISVGPLVTASAAAAVAGSEEAAVAIPAASAITAAAAAEEGPSSTAEAPTIVMPTPVTQAAAAVRFGSGQPAGKSAADPTGSSPAKPKKGKGGSARPRAAQSAPRPSPEAQSATTEVSGGAGSTTTRSGRVRRAPKRPDEE